MNILKRDIVDYIISEKPKFVAHGCNCQQVMGAGVAKRLASTWGSISSIDKNDNREFHRRLGDYTSIWINENTRVYNFYTQLYPGPHFDPAAFSLCLQKFVIENTTFDEKGSPILPTLVIPMIGNGIGKPSNWSWEGTEFLIDKYLAEANVVILDKP